MAFMSAVTAQLLGIQHIGASQHLVSSGVPLLVQSLSSHDEPYSKARTAPAAAHACCRVLFLRVEGSQIIPKNAKALQNAPKEIHRPGVGLCC